jgi:hypothetical protein
MTFARDLASFADSASQNLTFRNAIINGAMQVWQRGTSVAVSGSSAYTFAADRWGYFRGSYATGMTVSRQATGDTTNLPNIQYCARVQRDSGNTSTQIIYVQQNFETVNSIPLVGKTVTLSFYARAGANFSSASNVLSFGVNTGTGTDQSLLSGYTGSASPISTNVTLTTTWQRFSATATLSSSATQIGIGFNYTPVGTASTNDYFEITGVQLEAGPAATPFETRPFQTELALCQRYYYRSSDGNVYQTYGIGFATSLQIVDFVVPLPVIMRTAPTTTLDAASLAISDGVTAYTSGSFVLINSSQAKNIATIRYTHGTTVLTTHRPYRLEANNSTSSYIGVSAEL